MIRLIHLTGSLQGTEYASEKPALRVGLGADCDIRFDGDHDPTVAPYHAAIVQRDSEYFVLDTGSTQGTLVNGERFVGRRTLKGGDRLTFGGPSGPEVQVEITIDAGYDPHHDEKEITEVLRSGTTDASQVQVVREAAKRVVEERAKAGGIKSRQTMAILAEAMRQVTHVAQLATQKRWRRALIVTASVALVFITGLSVVIWLQHRQITQLLADKSALDQDIRAVQEQMRTEQDSSKLASLEGTLAALIARAERTLVQLNEADARKAAQAVDEGDELDRDIRKILAKFSASTYAVPPIFKERLAYHIDALLKSGSLRTIQARKQRYWPLVTKEFNALGLPEEMAYISWTESQLDPMAFNKGSGARGMWQMTVSTAQGLGLKVEGGVDERTDVPLQTRAAARYIARLLAEFGEDSFMLAMAGYNRGENGVRRVLHQIALEPGGFRKAKRDFWHLYRLKKLPPETREYVPKVLAAAIVGSNPERYKVAAK